MSMRRALLIIVTIAGATLLAPAAGYAETITWTGEGDSTSWHDAANWDLGRQPGTGDDVLIPDLPTSAYVEYSSGNTSINSLACDEVFRLTGGDFGCTGKLIFNDVLTLSGGDLEGTGVINANGGLTIDGAVDMRGDGVPETPDLTLYNNSDDPGATFTGAGEINMYHDVVFNNTGTVYVETDHLVLNYLSGSNAPKCTNSGTFVRRVREGVATIDVDFDNSGTVDVQVGTLKLSRGFDNFADSTLTDGMYYIVGTFAFRNAAIATNSARIVLDGPGSQITDTSGADALASFASNAADAEFTVTGARELTTAGAFDNAGTLSIGTQSRFVVTGDYTQTGSGVLAIDLHAVLQAVEHGVLQVDAAATLDGTLDVSLIDEDLPATDGSYTLIPASTIKGAFASENLPPLPSELSWSVRYEADNVVLDYVYNCPRGDPDGDDVWGCDDVCPTTYAPGGVSPDGRPLGDIDIDCDVDLDDYVMFLRCITGPEASVAPFNCAQEDFDAADVDEDEDVDLADFVVFQRQVGSPLPALNRMRILVPGDTWTFEDQRAGTLNGEAITATGTTNVEVLTETVTDLAGATASMLSGTFEGILNGEQVVTQTETLYFSQDVDGSLYNHGHFHPSMDPPVERFVEIPREGKIRTLESPLAVGATNKWNVVYDDGATMVGASVVVSIDPITTPMGSFLAAKIVVSQILVAGTVTTSYNMTSWVAPQLGIDVKLVTDMTYRDKADGTEIIVHDVRTLSDTNVPR